jgi:hypothetical protein
VTSQSAKRKKLAETLDDKEILSRRLTLTRFEAMYQARERLIAPLILLIKLYVKPKATPTLAAFFLSKLAKLKSRLKTLERAPVV